MVSLSEDDSSLASGTGLRLVHIPLSALSDPTDAQVAQFLRVATDRAGGPVFVHCRAGADRTGTMCALYRVAVQGWTPQEAVDEMTRGGFNFHSEFSHLARFVQSTDFSPIKAMATSQPATGP